jgi:transposase
VMMDGWPIAHHLFAGNRLDQNTVLEVVEDLRQRFGLNRMILVGDCGLVTLRNLEELHQAQQGYLLGLQRRNRQNVYEYIQQAHARSDWQECPAGIIASEKSAVSRTRVVEVPGREPEVRIFVVHSEDREQYERSVRELRWSGCARVWRACRRRWRRAS